jgi:hypothetical protein
VRGALRLELQTVSIETGCVSIETARVSVETGPVAVVSSARVSVIIGPRVSVVIGRGVSVVSAPVSIIIARRVSVTIAWRVSVIEGAYRAQIVAYTCARLVKLALDQPGSGGLNYAKVWTQQSAGPILLKQMGRIGEVVARVLHNPPVSGRNVSEWAKQQACRKSALEAKVPVVKGIEDWIITGDERRAIIREQRTTGQIDQSLDAVTQVLEHGESYWQSLREFCQTKRILSPFDERALVPACQIPRMLPTETQVARLLNLIERAVGAGWQAD